jgi:hypothetical protein
VPVGLGFEIARNFKHERFFTTLNHCVESCVSPFFFITRFFNSEFFFWCKAGFCLSTLPCNAIFLYMLTIDD